MSENSRLNEHLQFWTHPVVTHLATLAGGIAAAVILGRIQNRRSLLTYTVNSQHVALSSDDAVFGKVEVKWNGNDVSQLYLNTIEIRNASARDLEQLNLRIFSNDGFILTERTQLMGTAQILTWTPEYEERVRGPKVTTDPTDDIQFREREYLIPTLNRGQSLQLTYLCASRGEAPPTVWPDIQHKGVRVALRSPQPTVLGVETPLAAATGSAIALAIAIIGVVLFGMPVIWTAVLLLIALAAQAPGALVVRAYRALDRWAAG